MIRQSPAQCKFHPFYLHFPADGAADNSMRQDGYFDESVHESAVAVGMVSHCRTLAAVRLLPACNIRL